MHVRARSDRAFVWGLVEEAVVRRMGRADHVALGHCPTHRPWFL